MAEITIMGELLVEIMRPHEDIPLYESDYFRGPFPSGAPGIFISTAALPWTFYKYYQRCWK